MLYHVGIIFSRFSLLFGRDGDGSQTYIHLKRHRMWLLGRAITPRTYDLPSRRAFAFDLSHTFIIPFTCITSCTACCFSAFFSVPSVCICFFSSLVVLFSLNFLESYTVHYLFVKVFFSFIYDACFEDGECIYNFYARKIIDLFRKLPNFCC